MIRAPLFVAALTGILCLAAPLAAAPDPLPGFSAPTEITNIHAPFTPDSVKIFFGRSEGTRTVTLERQTEQTRLFHHEGKLVEARVMLESEFVDGELVEITTHYLAQDDAGNVRYFGEVAVEYDGGVVVGTEPDSWVVDGPSPGDDPAGVHVVRNPAMYMPATLEVGTTFDMESIPGESELITVVATDAHVVTPAGEFHQVVQLQADGEDDPDIVIEYRYVAAGVGAVKEVAPSKRSVLVATSFSDLHLGLEASRER